VPKSAIPPPLGNAGVQEDGIILPVTLISMLCAAIAVLTDIANAVTSIPFLINAFIQFPYLGEIQNEAKYRHLTEGDKNTSINNLYQLPGTYLGFAPENS
jgi:hypothetical protein